MTLEDFKKNTIDMWKNSELVYHVLESENSILVNCKNESCFLVNILESKFTFLHNDTEDNKVKEYFSTHSKKEFAETLLKTAENHQGFFLYYMLFTKLEEKGIIDKCLYYHILDSIVDREYEFEEFILRVLQHYL